MCSLTLCLTKKYMQLKTQGLSYDFVQNYSENNVLIKDAKIIIRKINKNTLWKL